MRKIFKVVFRAEFFSKNVNKIREYYKLNIDKEQIPNDTREITIII